MTNQHRVVGQMTADSTYHRVPEDLRNRARSSDDGIRTLTLNQILRNLEAMRTLGHYDFGAGLGLCKPTENSDEKHQNVNVGNVKGAFLIGQVLEQLCERVTENLRDQIGNEPLHLSWESLNVEGAFQ